MATVNEVINEIKALRGAEVQIFGQKFTLSDKADDYTIDIIDILEDLKDFESIDNFNSDELEYWNYIESNNSYNWGGCVSNDFDYSIYELDGLYMVEFKVHKYGDVRGNYTDCCYLVFNSIDEFLITIAECDIYKSVTIDDEEYNFTISALSDSFEVYDSNDNYMCTAYGYDLDSITECIKDKRG